MKTSPHRICIAIIIIVVTIMLAACGGGSTSTKLSGSPEDILNRVLDEAKKSLPDDKPMPESRVTEVTADTSQNAIGLSTDDFNKYVSSASIATALIGTFPHEIGVIQAKDAASAATIKKLISSDGGYNSLKWICVSPEESCVLESGSYVLLAASRADVVDAVVSAFTAAAGNVGERNVFFTSEKGASEGGPAAGGGISLAPL